MHAAFQSLPWDFPACFQPYRTIQWSRSAYGTSAKRRQVDTTSACGLASERGPHNLQRTRPTTATIVPLTEREYIGRDQASYSRIPRGELKLWFGRFCLLGGTEHQ